MNPSFWDYSLLEFVFDSAPPTGCANCRGTTKRALELATVQRQRAELDRPYKESYCKHGEAVPVVPARREYSGQFNVRIDKRLHRALAIEAARAGVSLNALVAQKLAKSIKHERS